MEEKQVYRDDEIDIWGYLIVIAKYKKLILGITFLSALIAVAVSLFMTPVYKSETKILPPQHGSASMTSQLLGQLGGLGGAAGWVKSSNDLYIGLIKSRPVLDSIIDRFELMSLYKAKYREDARKNLIIVLSAHDDKKSGFITIGVEDRDPVRAANIANAFVEELRNLNKKLAVTEAGQRRLFFEEQLNDSKEALIRSEESIKGFQEKTGAIRIDDQARVAIEGIAQLKAQIAGKEVQIKVMKTYATANNPDIQRAEEELKGMGEQLAKLEVRGSGHNPDVTLLPGKIPSLGTEYIRKLRDFKYNEAVYELLLKQYEAARLDEARDAAIIQVIEKAIPPENKIKPRRSRIVITVTIIGFLISVVSAFLLEFIEKSSNNPEMKMRLEILKRYIVPI